MKELLVDSFSQAWTNSDMTFSADDTSTFRGYPSAKIELDITNTDTAYFSKTFDPPIRAQDGFVEFYIRTNGFGQFLQFCCGEKTDEEFTSVVTLVQRSDYQLVRIDLNSWEGRGNIKKVKFKFLNQNVYFASNDGTNVYWLAGMDDDLWGPGGAIEEYLWSELIATPLIFNISHFVALLYEPYDIGQIIKDRDGDIVPTPSRTIEFETDTLQYGEAVFCRIPFNLKAKIEQLHIVSSEDVDFDFEIYERESMDDDRDLIFSQVGVAGRIDFGTDLLYEDLDGQNKLFMKIYNESTDTDSTFFIKIKYTPVL